MIIGTSSDRQGTRDGLAIVWAMCDKYKLSCDMDIPFFGPRQIPFGCYV